MRLEGGSPMRKVAIMSAVLALVLGFAGMSLAAEKQSWTGWIADSNCAKNYAKAGNESHVSCAKTCLSRGASWALSMPDGYVLLDVDAKEAEAHLGQEVIVNGELDKETNTVKVTGIEKPGDSD